MPREFGVLIDDDEAEAESGAKTGIHRSGGAQIIAWAIGL
jgi:hypothetical protein